VLTDVRRAAAPAFAPAATLFAEMPECAEVDRLVLLERRLVSRELSQSGAGSAVLVRTDESASIMVNEEDHLRIQAMLPGFCLRAAWQQADAVDSVLAASLTMAFTEELGFLTACPTNLGTGMRASVMLHLPGLMLLGLIPGVVRAAEKLGLAVRGAYGEGTEATGNLFQVSNQSTLGESESEILERVERVVRQLIENEKCARLRLVRRQRRRLYDHVGRAYGSLRHAYLLSSAEALGWLSAVRLGVELGLVSSVGLAMIHELMISTQPGHLQKLAAKSLSSHERDALRADVVRNRIRRGESGHP
jgi:protein arginine kinase